MSHLLKRAAPPARFFVGRCWPSLSHYATATPGAGHAAPRPTDTVVTLARSTRKAARFFFGHAHKSKRGTGTLHPRDEARPAVPGLCSTRERRDHSRSARRPRRRRRVTDLRSYAAKGIALEPQNKIGPAGVQREALGQEVERPAAHEAQTRNSDRIIADPAIVLAALTQQQSTSTRRDLARLWRHSRSAGHTG